MRFLTAVALALVMLGVPVDGVAQRNPLTTVSQINNVVVVIWDDDIEGNSEAQFTQEIENAFELGLLRTGIRLTPGYGPKLQCLVHTMQIPNDPRIAYSIGVSYHEVMVDWGSARRSRESGDPIDAGDSQIVATWSESTVGYMGKDVFSGTPLGEWCIEGFEIARFRASN